MKRIYLSHPYGGHRANREKAAALAAGMSYGQYVALREAGMI